MRGAAAARHGPVGTRGFARGRRSDPPGFFRGVLGPVLLLAATAAPPLRAAPATPGVTVVRLDPPDVVPASERKQLVTVREHAPYDAGAVERTRANLLATGRFSAVEARLSDGGVLTFALVPRPYVHDLTVKGNHQLSRWQLLRRLDLKIWHPVSDAILEAVPAQVADAYTRSGLPAPDVRVEARPERAGATAFTLHLTEHALPRLTQFRYSLEGFPWVESLSTRAELLVYSWRGKRSGYNKKDLEERMRKEQRRIRALGWRGAVLRVAEEPEPGGGAVSVRVTLELGPKEELKGKDVDRRVLKEVSTSWRRRNVSLSEGVVNRLARSATEGMKERGYLDVEIRPVVTQGEEKRTVTLTAARGTRTFVAEVVFEGTWSLPEKDLRKAALLHTPRYLGLSKSRPGPLALEESAASLTALYAERGYPDAKVTSRLDGDGAARRLVFSVTEGRRQVLDSVLFRGATALKEARLRRLARLKAGDPYWPVAVEKAAEEIRKEYHSRGFSAASVTPKAVEAADGSVALAFEVVEGPRYDVGTLVVAGSFKTKASRILALGDERTGRPLDPEQIAKHQTRLSTLGIFDSVSIRTVDETGASSPRKTILVEVADRPTGYVEYGLDINTDRGIEVAATLGERNLFGSTIAGSLSTLLGTKRQNVAASVSQPTFLGLPVYTSIRGSYTNDETFDGFVLVTTAADFGLSWSITDKKLVSLTYRVENQRPTDVQPDVSADLDAETVRIGSITPSVSLSTRDDPFVPTEGDYILARAKVSRKGLGGETDYERLELQYNWYKTFFDTVTVATAARVGYAHVAEGEELPVGERFYIGGANTHRGFHEKELGPVGEDGSSLGGQSYVLGNLEARFPLIGPFAGGVFLDVGNAYLQRIDLTDLRWALGAGLRLGTPVGPLRLDAGFKLDRKPGESAYVLHVALGHAF